MKKLNRRIFLKTTAISAAGLSVVRQAHAKSVSNTKSAVRSEILTRTLGKTGIKVPVVSMGVGGCDSPAVVKAALKVGINHFDTAYVYQGGNSEKMLGEVLKEYPRDSFSIATKVKTYPTREEYLSKFEESLERLQMEFVDILYLHSIDSREKALNPTMVDTLKEIKSSGKARFIGLSTHSNEPEIVQAAIDSGVYDVVLIAYNFKQDHREELLEKCREANEKGIGIVAMKVMAGGFLDKEKTKPVNHKAALKWSLQDEAIHTTIPSLNNMEQLQENMQVLNSIALSEKELSDLEMGREIAGLYCDGCKSCKAGCPKNLEIPDIMRAYMYAYAYGQTKKAHTLASEHVAQKNPCKDCLLCTAKCKKGFAIPEKVAAMQRLSDFPIELLA